MRTVSLVVPTYEMSAHLEALWASLEGAGLFDVVSEVVIVDDGSKDDTPAVVERLRTLPRGSLIVPVRLARNMGRYRARVEGAKTAKGSHVLFLDTRVELPKNFGEALRAAADRYPAVMGNVDVDVTRNVFCLYWDRSHKRIFRRHYEATKKPLTLDEHNYDDYLKGTGVLLCDREVFLECCAKFEDLLSDDTLLLKELVKKTPITIPPDVRISWVPREDWRAFLGRIWERGPGFVEYHVIERRGVFFWAVVVGGVVVIGIGALSVVAPPIGLAAAVTAAFGTVASTALFARSPGELVRLAPLHVAVVGTFGASVVRGLVVNAKRIAERRLTHARH